MPSQLKTAVVATSILWAGAIGAAAILKAPNFLTLVLLPLLCISSLGILQDAGRKMLKAQTVRS